MKSLKGLFVLESSAYSAVYAPAAALEIEQRVEVVGPPHTSKSIWQEREILSQIDVLFSGWGSPRIDEAFLAAAPRLKAIFYGAGAINVWATPAVWERKIVVTTANQANAIPVAEYTLSTILFSLKHGWRLCREKQVHRGFQIRGDIPGNYQSVVGLVGMGTIACLVARMLAPFNMTILTHDPFLSVEKAAELGVINVGLAELFDRADVVSLHAPNTPATRGMIGAKLLGSMKKGATLINTARGKVVREDELIAVLERRPDLQAVLDVTEEDPLPADSPLITLPNVVLTPHIAGSQGRECQRMGQYMVEELDRYIRGIPLLWRVRAGELVNSVHHPVLV
jgi:phosphoglycerate dehydrogenase-like enzyme